MLRMHRQSIAARSFATSSADYHSLEDQIFYTPTNKPAFSSGNNFVVFNSDDINERRFVPFEMKENIFKHAMGVGGAMMLGQLVQLGGIPYFASACFVLNGTYRAWQMMGSTVRKIELHPDGKTVSFYPAVASKFDVAIKDIKKLKHEKNLLDTFEEAYLFPVEINGKKWLLHGNGHESVKNGEVFRAILNGQSIKL